MSAFSVCSLIAVPYLVILAFGGYGFLFLEKRP